MTQNKDQTKDSRRWLKHGMLAAPCTVKLTAAPVANERFPEKSNLLFDLDGQPFGLSVTRTNPQWGDLEDTFGEPGPSWVGKVIRLSDGQKLKQVNVEPVSG